MDIFDTNVLIGTVRSLKRPPTFLLDKFFPGIAESDSEFVSIDVDTGKRRMAPFCSPVVQGRIVEGRSIQTDTFRPAYIKDKRAPDLKRPVKRQIGERIGGNLSPEERMQANLQFELEDQVQSVDRRLVWMASNALLQGQITVTGEGFQTTVINFNRDPNLQISLAGSAAWGSAAYPSDNFDDWSALVLESSGAIVTDLVFTPTPWKLFRADQKVKDSIWFPRSGDSSIELGGGIKNGAIYKGRWGDYDLWVYNDWYVDLNTDTSQPMIPDGYVIGGSTDMQGVRAFGSILDPNFAYGALAYAPRSWIENDPAQRVMMMQSAPVVIPSRVNAAFAANVTGTATLPPVC